MSSQDDDSHGIVFAVLAGVILLAISLAIGVGLYRTSKGAAAVTAAQGATGGAGAGAMAAAGHAGAASGAVGDDAASVRVEEGVVKFYFATAKADLATGAKEALGDVVKGVAAGKTAVISGYHDATGDAARNEELAKQRALAVRDALLSLGIGEDKVELKKPEVSTASGSNAEARRVEVTLQ
ncbi:OmpA family protein [Ottowia sp.]|jgi:outer membrane protein OmpA-like peptidoglycan-associated protein|uniref:OmpA family protein n=1 Tax=Ottowia sp. TaxID=1898956 RepID=UPI0025DF2403|nr:OmpA family protein [Ottowia sp.]MBK6615717.1 OmpA family protein [Ottowia sp.]MBK6746780.1 OmpA family protein [Ottowia sp.]